LAGEKRAVVGLKVRATSAVPAVLPVTVALAVRAMQITPFTSFSLSPYAFWVLAKRVFPFSGLVLLYAS
jgi:hypothetical protein